jgi:hypothetical protein
MPPGLTLEPLWIDSKRESDRGRQRSSMQNPGRFRRGELPHKGSRAVSPALLAEPETWGASFSKAQYMKLLRYDTVCYVTCERSDDKFSDLDNGLKVST